LHTWETDWLLWSFNLLVGGDGNLDATAFPQVYIIAIFVEE